MPQNRPRPASRPRPSGRPAARRPQPGRPSLPPGARKWLPAAAAAVVLGVVAVAGFSGGNSAAGPEKTTGSTSADVSDTGGGEVAGTDPGATDDNPGAVDDTDSAPIDTGAQVVVDTDPAIQKTPLGRNITIYSFGNDVKMVQQRLSDLGFWPGKIDGNFGPDTQQAVWAYKKLVLGVPREELAKSSNKSQITPAMWDQMQDPITINPRRPRTGTHVEIYLPEQVMVVFTDNKVTLVAHISSGSEETWCETLSYNTDDKGEPIDPPRTSDECGVSHTPGGIFKFYRRYEGDRVGPLGGMYNPVYFNYGIAVHGAQKVPMQPASHGCIRINMDLSKVFPQLVKNGNRVYVWGQDGREPESYTRRERTPPFNYPDPNATTTTSTTEPPATTDAPATTAKPTTTPKTTVSTEPKTTTTKTTPPTKAPVTSEASPTTKKEPSTTKPEPVTSGGGP